MAASKEEIQGAWIIHHGRKLLLDLRGAAEFPAIDEAAKASTLLCMLGQTEEAVLPLKTVQAIATEIGLNPRYELSGLLGVLKSKRLIDTSEDSVAVLGVTTRASLAHASELFTEANPKNLETASIDLAELASQAPVRRSDVSQKIQDEHSLTSQQTVDLFDRAEQIGFVDTEGSGHNALLFNGNLFRRESVEKCSRVLSSLSPQDRQLLTEINAKLGVVGCITSLEAERILTPPLFSKLVAAGLFDLNQVNNEVGTHILVTLPSAFHKFVDPIVDDCFDMAKALVAALTYGMTLRSSSQGRINLLPALLSKLIGGHEVGPTTSIGADYRTLERSFVVQTRPDPIKPGRFYLKLLKREVGELALQVLTQGNAFNQSLAELPGAPMSGYVGPEECRVGVRRKNRQRSDQSLSDVLEAVRSGRTF